MVEAPVVCNTSSGGDGGGRESDLESKPMVGHNSWHDKASMQELARRLTGKRQCCVCEQITYCMEDMQSESNGAGFAG